MKRLEILYTDFTHKNYMLLGKQLRLLPKLSKLDLSGPTTCPPKYLSSATFFGMNSIRYLDLSYNYIKEIWKGTFSAMGHLEYLDISYNTRLGLSGVANVTFDLPSTSIKIFKFKKIVQTFAMNQMLMKEQLEPLKNTSLREVYADSNRLQLVELCQFLTKNFRKNFHRR